MTISIRPTTYDAAALERYVGGIPSLYLEVVSGLNNPAEVRGKDSVVPHAEGGIPRNRKKSSRRIIAAGFAQGVAEDTQAAMVAFQLLMDELTALFSYDRAPALLAVVVPGGTVRSCMARPLNWTENETVRGLYTELTVEFLSLDPDWASDSSSS